MPERGEEESSRSLRELDARLKRLKAEVAPLGQDAAADQPPSGLGMAFGMAGHLVAGIAVGAGLGWFLDRWLGTAPGLFIVFLFLGAASGMLNVYRTATRQGMAIGYRPAPGKLDEGKGGPTVDAVGPDRGDKTAVRTPDDCADRAKDNS